MPSRDPTQVGKLLISSIFGTPYHSAYDQIFFCSFLIPVFHSCSSISLSKKVTISTLCLSKNVAISMLCLSKNIAFSTYCLSKNVSYESVFPEIKHLSDIFRRTQCGNSDVFRKTCITRKTTFDAI